MVDDPNWMRKDNKGHCKLPNKYDSRYKLEAVDVSKMPIMFESFENFGEYVIYSLQFEC